LTVDTPFLTPAAAVRRRQRSYDPRRIAWRLLALAVLTGLALFFAIPIVWLLLAPTKTDYNLVAQMPFDFGSFGQVVKTWDHLYLSLIHI